MLRLPIIGVTLDPVPETRYDTVVVYSQWDGWANPPDRPWNLLAVLNAVISAVYRVPLFTGIRGTLTLLEFG